MNWNEIISMLNSPDIENRKFAYEIIIQWNQLIEEEQRNIILGILNNLYEYEIYTDDNEYLEIIKTIHSLNIN